MDKDISALEEIMDKQYAKIKASNNANDRSRAGYIFQHLLEAYQEMKQRD